MPILKQVYMDSGASARAAQGLPLPFQEPEFFRARIWPILAPDQAATVPEKWKVKLAQSSGTGRVTVALVVDGEIQGYAKAYRDPGDGLGAYELLRALWENGFGSVSPFRVPEPLAYFAEHQVLLVRPAVGERLPALAARDGGAWGEGIAAAARWLVALHTSPVRVGAPEDRLQEVFRLARRLAELPAFTPEAEDRLPCFVDELADRARILGASRQQVQTHGRYLAGHVFVSAEAVTTIDLDRSGPGDPARDVAEFVHRLLAEVKKGTLDPDSAERATTLFLQEYRRRCQCDPAALAYYWSYAALRMVLRSLQKGYLDPETRNRHVQFHLAEFSEIPQRTERLLPR